jgi:hypothetical protein
MLAEDAGRAAAGDHVPAAVQSSGSVAADHPVALPQVRPERAGPRRGAGLAQAAGRQGCRCLAGRAGWAPLAALEAAQGEGREALDELLRQLAQPGVDGALRAADKLQKTPAAELVGWVQRWLYDLLSLKSAGVVRYYPRYGKELGRLAERVDALALSKALRAWVTAAPSPIILCRPSCSSRKC